MLIRSAFLNFCRPGTPQAAVHEMRAMEYLQTCKLSCRLICESEEVCIMRIVRLGRI